MNKGSLVHEDYFDLFKNNNINYNKYTSSQIQPSSLDLTLSAECYEIEASFLSPNTNIRDKLINIVNKKIDLNEVYIFKKNITYIVRLNEKLNLKNDIFGKCNPKSSTGRLDIFCRAILNFSDEYEKIDIKLNNFSQEFFNNYSDLLMIFQNNTMLHNKLRKIALLLEKDEWVNFIDTNIFFNDISNEEALKKLNNILITSQDKRLIDFAKKKIKLISNE